MKKIILLIILICLPFYFAGCQTIQNDLEQEVFLEFEAQYIRTNGYASGTDYPVISLINSVEELNEYYMANKDTYDLERRKEVYSDTTIGFQDAIDKYDNEYFKDNLLVLVLLEEGSGSIRHTVTRVISIGNHQTEIGIKRIIPDVGTDDMAEWHIMIELKREAYNGSPIVVIFNNTKN